MRRETGVVGRSEKGWDGTEGYPSSGRSVSSPKVTGRHRKGEWSTDGRDWGRGRWEYREKTRKRVTEDRGRWSRRGDRFVPSELLGKGTYNSDSSLTTVVDGRTKGHETGEESGDGP